MSDTSTALLRQAYELIENDELERAQELLAPLVEDDAGSAHLWWVYTHALRDAGMGQAALERVLALDPDYPGARELKADVLEAQSKDPDLIAFDSSEPIGAQSAADYQIEDWENLPREAVSDSDGASWRGRLAMLLVLLIIVAGGGLVLSGAVDLPQLLSEILPPPEAQVIVVTEPTSEPAVAGDEPSSVSPELEEEPRSGADSSDEAEEPGVEPVPMERSQPEAGTPPVVVVADVAAFVELVAAAIDDFEIAQSETDIQSTELGNTLVMRVCSIPGPELSQRLDTVLHTVASLFDDLPEGIEAVAAGLIHCGDDSAILRVIGVSRGVLAEFAAERIKAKDFQRAWQPLS
ncbi:MAG: hypothetical protein OXG85_09080 [Chloroflexi bacterium]|nr:hypothetical protein [Chloroflexota bacterium]